MQLDDSLFVEIEIGQSVVVDDPMGLSLSWLLMPTTALVIYSSSFIVFGWLCIVFCCLIGLLIWVFLLGVLVMGNFTLFV